MNNTELLPAISKSSGPRKKNCGAAIEIPASKAPAFKAGKAFKDAIQ